MRIAFVSSETLNRYVAQGREEVADVTLFGFNGVGEVSYEKELKGESRFFEEVATLSKRNKNVVICGCITDTRGHKRKSVAVAENGRLLGVSDMLNAVDGECSAGANLRIYETKIGKMGVIVAGDLYFPETVKALSLCGSEFIVCPFEKTITPLERSYLCVYAHTFALPIFVCGEGFSMIIGAEGELIFSSPLSPIFAEYERKKQYHLVETRCARKFFPRI
ncbi:MAG: hypothetical protein J6K86_04885 [Clostridia bacterium]|nr:hypothetical protein [Clostridia bacterium]